MWIERECATDKRDFVIVDDPKETDSIKNGRNSDGISMFHSIRTK